MIFLNSFILIIDFILNETTFRRWETNLRNLNENGRKALKYKKNRIATKPDAENNKITFFNENLDKYQKRAVERAITSNDFFLIHGPFGTGKTTTIIEIILQEVKLNHTVLVSGESNTAIDNILKKLKKKHNKLNFTRVGTSVLNDNAEYLKKSLFEELITNYKHQSQELLIQYRMNEILMKFPNKKFYENKLKCSKKSKNYYLNKVLKKYDSTSPLIFIDTSKHENKKEKNLRVTFIHKRFRNWISFRDY